MTHDSLPKRRLTSEWLRNTSVVIALGGAVLLWASYNNDSSSTYDTPEAAVSYSPSDSPSPFLSAPETTQSPSQTQEPQEAIKPARVKHISIDSIGIDMPIKTVKIPIKEGHPIYDPEKLMELYSADIKYDPNSDGDIDFIAGTLGTNENGEIPAEHKIIIYGHTNSGGPGALNKARYIEKGAKLEIETNNGVFVYERLFKVASDKDTTGATPELEESLDKADLLILTCQLTKDGNNQTGQRIVLGFRFVGATSVK